MLVDQEILEDVAIAAAIQWMSTLQAWDRWPSRGSRRGIHCDTEIISPTARAIETLRFGHD
jgi:hypothetical protein